uniref:Uncharacterized protein n=1 Tax=Spongospora subterranea TaxID=70186 RepID=A0A0H5R8Q6_9EUKA|eukprot:CRZ10508.1 hypothetical protein [Spongospora subterranea]
MGYSSPKTVAPSACATVFDCAFSSDGALFAAVDNTATLSVWNTDNITSVSDRQDNPLSPCCVSPLFQADTKSGPLYSVIFAGHYIITGGDLNIKLWNVNSPAEEPMSTMQNPRLGTCSTGYAAVAETNGLAYCSESGQVFSASGQNVAYQWDLNTSTVVNTFRGHSDYLHCICMGSSSHTIITGSEDGTARLWDTRTSESQATFTNPDTKDWVGSISCSGDWLSYGTGSGNIYTYHLGSQSLFQTFQGKASVLSLTNIENVLISAGYEPVITSWNQDGTHKSRVNCDAEYVYSLKANPTNARLRMACAGSASMISFFTDLQLPPSIRLSM